MTRTTTAPAAPPIRKIDFNSRESFFHQIVSGIEAAIAGGHFPPGAEFPSIPQMARYYGISQKPVQEAYRRLVEVGALTSRSGQGTRVHEDARGNLRRLRAGAPRRSPASARSPAAPCVAMLVPTVESSLHSAITRMIETRLCRRGRHMILGNYQENLPGLKRYIRSLTDRNDCEAIILSPFRTDFSQACIDALKAAQDRLLLLANRLPDLRCPCLILDNEKGGCLGAQHLFRKGHRSILFMSGPANNATALGRETGALGFLRKAGGAEAVVERGDFFPDRAYQHTVKVFRRRRPFSAVFCVNSLTCIGVLRALHDLRVRIPEEVSVLTFDDMDYPTNVPMTVVRQPLSLMADKAVSLIENRGEWSGSDVLFAPELVERDSVAPVPPG